MKYKTTEEHFEVFKKECEKWIEFFHLGRWRVFFEHGTHKSGYGWCEADHPGAVATIGLSIDWDDNEPTESNLQRTAFHEVCELVVSPLERLAESRYGVLEEDITQASHQIIRTLENSVWKEDMRKDDNQCSSKSNTSATT